MNQDPMRTYRGPNIEGWMTDSELDWLFHRAREMENILEVGSWMGRSTHALLSGCRGPVYAVDHFKGSNGELHSHHKRALTEDIHEIFQRNVGHFKNLVSLKMDSLEAAKLFADKWIDMIFIDGGHLTEELKADIFAWKPKAGKLLCGHDLHEPTVKKALDDLGMKVMNEAGTIWSMEI